MTRRAVAITQGAGERVSTGSTVCVYRGNSPTDAWLVLHWLQRNEIPAWIRGDLQGAIGEIPVPESWPTIWVNAENRARADEALRLFRAPTLVRPAWNCPRCGEANEPNFDGCWSCDGDRPAAD